MNGNADLLAELRRMNRLLALVLTKDLQARTAIPLLSKAGYTQPEIGSLLGMTSNAVHLTLKRIRRSGKASQATGMTDDE